MAQRLQTAREALEIWRHNSASIDDAYKGIANNGVYADAQRTLQLIEMESISIDELIPDEAERDRLRMHAKRFDEVIEEDGDYVDEMAHVPDADGFEPIVELEEDRHGQ